MNGPPGLDGEHAGRAEAAGVGGEAVDAAQAGRDGGAEDGSEACTASKRSAGKRPR